MRLNEYDLKYGTFKKLEAVTVADREHYTDRIRVWGIVRQQ